jgi:hypothetical protein
MVAVLAVIASGQLWPAVPLRAEEQTRQGILLAERRAKALRLEPEHLSAWEARIRWIEETRLPEKVFVRGWHGLRPIIGGAPQGAGTLAGGIGYTRGLDSEHLRVSASARTSTNRYHMLDAGLVFPTELSGWPLRVELGAGFHDLRRFSFFGVGNDSADRRTFYQLKEATAGGRLDYRAAPSLMLGATGRWLSARTDDHSKSPTVGSVFTGDQAPPGFEAPRTEFAVYGGHALLDLRDDGFPAVGPELRLEATRYEDVDNRFDFTVLEAELVTYVPLVYRNRIIAARLATSHAMPDRGQQVPFYLMRPIGGSRTLRGFDSDRFRDRRSLVVNLEYRWEVWTYADFVLLYDSGKVFSDADDLDLSGLHNGYGFGVRAHAPAGGVLRFDITHSREGFYLYLWLGDALFFNE